MKIEIPAFTPMLKANEHLAHGAISIDLGDDVVMVVRCKDCKACERVEGGIPYCHEHQRGTFYNDFCSYGEREAEQNNG